MIFNMSGGGGNSLNFEVVGGTTEPASPKENTIWINTDVPVKEWMFSNTNPFLDAKLTISANHTINNSSTDITIVDNEDNSVVAFQAVVGTNSYSVFTDKVIPFTTVSGLEGTLTCSVRQTTKPFFIGTIVVAGVTVGTVSFGDGTNSSYAWSGEQAVSYTRNISENVGKVWIYTDTLSSAKFNALKKNVFEVYFLYSKQYIDGTWVLKAAKIFQNGTWYSHTVYVYKNGDISSMTGGWQKSWSSTWAATGAWYDNVTSIKVEHGSKSAGIGVWGRTKKTMDMTIFNNMYFHVSAITGTGFIAVHSTSTGWKWGDATSEKAVTTTGWHALDISSINGSFYAAIGVKGYATTESMTIDQIYLQC